MLFDKGSRHFLSVALFGWLLVFLSRQTFGKAVCSEPNCKEVKMYSFMLSYALSLAVNPLHFYLPEKWRRKRRNKNGREITECRLRIHLSPFRGTLCLFLVAQRAHKHTLAALLRNSVRNLISIYTRVTTPPNSWQTCQTKKNRKCSSVYFVFAPRLLARRLLMNQNAH